MSPTLQEKARVVVEFTTEGTKQTLKAIDDIQGSASSSLTEIYSGFQIFRTVVEGAAAALGSMFDAFVLSNEQTNKELLKTQTNLAGSLRLFKANGEEITDLNEKITATSGKLKESMKQIEKDTNDLVGVTTQEVNGVFQILLRNGEKFIGQSKEFTDPIDAATAATKNWVAALGTLGLPLEQANQEISAILNGDLNNPDSTIAQTLRISEQQYEQWKANGELMDRINEKLEIYAEGNKLAARSIEGVGSNIQSFFEDVARAAGEPLLDPIVDSMQSLYEILDRNRAMIETILKGNITKVADIFDNIREQAQRFSEALDIDAESMLGDMNDIMMSLLSALDEIITAVGELSVLLGPFLTYIGGQVKDIIVLASEGIGNIARLVTDLTAAVNEVIGGFLKAVESLPGPLRKSFEVISEGPLGALKQIRTTVGLITGDTQDSIAATKSFVASTAMLVDQSGQLADKAQTALEAAKNAAGEGRQMTEDEQKRVAVTKQLLDGQLDALKQQKKDLEELQTLRKSEEVLKDQSLQTIDAEIAKLTELSDGYGAISDTVTLQAREILELGDAYTVLEQKTAAAMNAFKSEGLGNKADFEKAANDIVELTLKQVEYGQMSQEVAREQLLAVTTNTKLEVDTRAAALDALNQMEQQYSDRRIASLESQKAAVEALEVAGGTGRKEALEQTVAIERQIGEEKLKVIEAQIKAQEQLGKDTTELLAQQKTALSELQKMEANAQAQRLELAKQGIEERIDIEMSSVEAMEVERLTATQRMLDEGLIMQETADKQKAQSAQKRINAELEAEKAKLAQLEALQPPVDEAGRIAFEQEIRDQRQKTSELQLNALEAQLDAERALSDEINAQIDRKQALLELETTKDNTALAQQELELQKLITDGQIRAADADKERLKLTQERIASEITAEEKKLEYLSGLSATNKDEEIANAQEVASVKESLVQKQIELERSQLEIRQQAAEQAKQAAEEQFSKQSKEVAKQYAETNLEISKAVLAGVITHEEAEAKKLELTLDRVNREIEIEEARIKLISERVVEGLDEQKQKEEDLFAAQEALLGLQAEQVGTLQSVKDMQDKLHEGDATSLANEQKLQDKIKERLALAESDLQNKNEGFKQQELQLETLLAKGLATTEQVEGKKLELAQQRISEEIKFEEAKIAALAASETSTAEEKLAKETELSKLREGLIGKQIEQVRLLGEEEKRRAAAAEAFEAQYLEDVQKRLDKQQTGVSAEYEKDLLKINKLVAQGQLTHEEAEKAKAKATADRVAQELKLEEEKLSSMIAAAQRFGMTEERSAEIAQQRIAVDQARNAVLEQQNSELAKQEDLQKRLAEYNQERVIAAEEKRIEALNEVNRLLDEQSASLSRQLQLQQSAIALQESYLALEQQKTSSQLDITRTAEEAAKRLAAIEKEKAELGEEDGERRKELIKEEQALQAKMGALGIDSQKSANELLLKRQQLEADQLAQQEAAAELRHRMQEQEIENARLQLKIDQSRMELKAKELEMQAKLLEMQGKTAKASAQQIEDPVERRRATDAANAQIEAGRQMGELAEQQREASKLQAEMEEKLLDSREKQLDLAKEADKVALEAQKKQLQAQHEYDQTMNDAEGTINYNPEVNVSTEEIDKAEAEYRDRLQQSIDSISSGDDVTKAAQDTASKLKEGGDSLNSEANEFAESARATTEETAEKLMAVAKKFNKQMEGITALEVPEISVPVNVEPAALEIDTSQKRVEDALVKVMDAVKDNDSIRKQIDSLSRIATYSKQSADKKSSFSSKVNVTVNVDKAGNQASTIDERLDNIECGH